MYFLVFFLLSSFDSIYGTNGVIPNNSNKLFKDTRLAFKNKEQVYVSKCIFNDISGNGAGGAIYTSTEGIELKQLIEYSTFSNCKGTGSGGAIYLYSDKGQCALINVCSEACTIVNPDNERTGLFASLIIGNDASHVIKVDLTSVSLSKTDDIKVKFTLRFYMGNHKVSNLNMSSNSCTKTPTIDSTSFKQDGCFSLSHSTFVNNIAKTYTVIDLKQEPNNPFITNNIKSCNFIKNQNLNQKINNMDENFGLYKTAYHVIISDSNFIGNIAERHFSISYGSVTLKNCYADSLVVNKPSKFTTELLQNEQININFDKLNEIICGKNVEEPKKIKTKENKCSKYLIWIFTCSLIY